jgi:hypothetical protein
MSPAEVRHEDLMDPRNWPTNETPTTPGWRFAHIGLETDPADLGGGLDPWTLTWGDAIGWIVVAHPSYPWQRHSVAAYAVSVDGRQLRFAAGELSNGVWGFYVPEDDDVA